LKFKAAPFTAKRNKLLEVTGFAADSKEAVFEASALEIILEFTDDVVGHGFALAVELFLEAWPVFLDDLIEQCGFGPVALIVDPQGWPFVEAFGRERGPMIHQNTVRKTSIK
jgi:hypothetical protein